MNISGGSISSNQLNAVTNYGTVNISGGTISQTGGQGNAFRNYSGGKTSTISGSAKITSSLKNYPTVYNDSGQILKMTGGTVTNSGGGYAIYNSGTCTVSGGTATPRYGC